MQNTNRKRNILVFIVGLTIILILFKLFQNKSIKYENFNKEIKEVKKEKENTLKLMNEFLEKELKTIDDLDSINLENEKLKKSNVYLKNNKKIKIFVRDSFIYEDIYHIETKIDTIYVVDTIKIKEKIYETKETIDTLYIKKENNLKDSTKSKINFLNFRKK